MARLPLLLLAGLLGACAGQPPLPASLAAADPGRHIVVTLPNLPLAPPPAAGSSRKGGAWGGPYRVSARAQATAAELQRDYPLTAVAAWPIRPLGVHCLVYVIRHGLGQEALLQALRADPRVESAQPLQAFHTLSAPAAGDPYRGMQHGMDALQLDAAHRWATGRGVRVAVIDTGVALSHPDLDGRIAHHQDLVQAPGDAFGDDAHGTAVAGVIGATAGNAVGIAGVAPQARIAAFKACWPTAGGAADCNSFTLARALVAALDWPAAVINLSLAGPADPLLERLLGVALERGVAVVGAVSDDPAQVFAGAVPGVIPVAAAERAPPPGAVQAPGLDVFSTVPPADYAFHGGSSFAAAHVSGIAALLLEHDPRLSGREVAQLLRDSSASAVNACRALVRLRGEGRCDRAAPNSDGD